MKSICLLIFVASIAMAQTSTIHLNVLHTLDGRSITNATVQRMNATFAIVEYESGGEKIAFTNLPPDIQKKFGFDPATAMRDAENEARRRQAGLLAQQQQSEALQRAAANLGPSQKVHIIGVLNEWHLQFVTTNGVIQDGYIHGIPISVVSFVKDLVTTKGEVEAGKYANANETYTAQIGRGRSAVQVSTATRTDVANTILNNRQHLYDLMTQEKAGASIVLAAPTGATMYGLRMWEYKGVQNTSLAPRH